MRRLGALVRKDASSTAPEAILFVTLVALILRGWINPIQSSFWLDETGTMWLTQGDFLSTIANSYRFQGGSPLFYVIEWPIRALFGTGEAVLRAPSVVGIGIAAFALARLGTRLIDRSAGLMIAVFFLILPEIRFAATDARPYALALGALSLSALFLCRWIDEGHRRDQILYAVCVAATIYLHYLVAFALLAHIPFFLVRNRRASRPVGIKGVATTVALLLALLIPLVPNILHVLGQRGALSNPFPRPAFDILLDLAPQQLVALTVGSVSLALVFANSQIRKRRDRWSGLVLASTWLVFPFGVVMTISAVGDTTLQINRYLLSTEPAIAILLGLIVALLPSQIGRWVCTTTAVIVFLIMSPPSVVHTSEDWRAAAAQVRSIADPSTPVLLFAGFIEAKQPGWLTDPITSSYLNAPAAAYEMDGTIFPAPWELTAETDAYLRDLLQNELTRSDKFILVTRSLDVTKGWLDANATPAGYSVTLSSDWTGEILMFVYEREPAT